MGIVIGIDVGGSTTKIVGFETVGSERRLITPQFVKADHPTTAVYGAFGKFTDDNDIKISDIDKVLITGVGASFVKGDMYGIPCLRVPEFTCIGKGGRYLSGLDNVLVVSMGTGTALVYAKADGEINYLGGTGVGGGTLLGLSKLLVGAENIDHIVELAEDGSLDEIDLRIKDMVQEDSDAVLNMDITAANFAKVSDMASRSDLALGVFNLVYETVGMVSVFAARSCGAHDIVLTGNITTLASCAGKYEEFNNLGYGVHFVIPELSEFSTAIGCALSAFD